MFELNISVHVHNIFFGFLQVAPGVIVNTYVMLVDNITEGTKELFIRPLPCYFLEHLEVLMKCCLHLMKYLLEWTKDDEDVHTFNKATAKLLTLKPVTENGKTLLHLSLDPQSSCIVNTELATFPTLEVTQYLVDQCIDVNALDDENNSPLHTCAVLLGNQHKDVGNKMAAVFLGRSDIHIDHKNSSGVVAYEALLSNGFDVCPIRYMALKCLAAQVISSNKIDVSNIPMALKTFVGNH